MHFRGQPGDGPFAAGSNYTARRFYLMFVSNGGLDGKYTVFGRVLSKRIEVLGKIRRRRNPSSRDEQADPDKIIEAKVLASGRTRIR